MFIAVVALAAVLVAIIIFAFVFVQRVRVWHLNDLNREFKLGLDSGGINTRRSVLANVRDRGPRYEIRVISLDDTHHWWSVWDADRYLDLESKSEWGFTRPFLEGRVEGLANVAEDAYWAAILAVRSLDGNRPNNPAIVLQP